MSQGDVERIPPSFRNDDGQMDSEAYRTVLIAMEVIKGRRGLSARDTLFSMKSAAIQGSP
jgi:hypothetical protein